MVKIHSYLNDFPRTTKTPHIGDIWVVKFPFREDGGYEKARPALIIDCFDDDKYLCKALTTNKDKGELITGERAKYLNKQAYLTNTMSILNIDKFYRRLYANPNYKEEEANDRRYKAI